MQITTHVRSLKWHSGKVLESIDRKSSRVVSLKPTRNVSISQIRVRNVTHEKLLNNIHNMT